MLSSVSSTDPLCSSSKVPVSRTDEKHSDQPAPSEPQISNFSIRDFVFASRRKGICTSWPFSGHSFKLYLKNGIQVLLPPFEPLSSVRTHCWRRQWASEEAKKILSNTQVSLLNGGPNSTETDSCLPSEDEEHDVERTVAQIIGPVVNPEYSREERGSASSPISDPMISKVCPVCKTFSSTSNTTLNAHMDQCLFMESDTNQLDEKLRRLKVKPRKKRLMEDLYATTPRCTLEDLDRRKDSSWASDFSFEAPKNETNSVAPKYSDSPVDHMGAVYVDSNGIKLRILSKFDDNLHVISREEIGPSKNSEGVGEGKIISVNKSKHFGAKPSKNMKFKLKNRKISSLMLFKEEMQDSPRVAGEGTRLETLGSLLQSSGEEVRINRCGWRRSKRSDPSKNVIRKGFKERSEHVKPVIKMPMLDTTHFSRSSEPEAIKLPAMDAQNKNNQRPGSASSALLKFSRSPGVLESSPRCTSEQLRMGSRKTFNKPAKHPFLPKTRRMSSLSVVNSTTQNLRKHRSLLKTEKRRRDLFSDEISGLGKSTDTIDPEEMDSHGKDPDPRCSEKANRTSLYNVDGNSMIVETAHAEEPCLPLDAIAEAGMSPLLEENGTPMEQMMPDKPKKQEFACLTATHGDLRPDSSLAYAQLVPTVDNNTAISRQQSESPASSASTISLPSPKGSLFKASDSVPVCRLSAAPEKSASRSSFMVANVGIQEDNQQVHLNSKVTRQHEQLSDYQPCCCSRQSGMNGTVPSPTNPKQLPNLYIKRISNYDFASYSCSKTSTPVLESPPGSILTKACSDFGSPSQSCGTPTQSTASSLFRLMGKNLMVMNTEDSAQFPETNSRTPDNSSNPLGFGSFTSLQNLHSFSNAAHTFPRNLNENSYIATDLMAARETMKDHVGFRSALWPLPVMHPMIYRPFPYIQQQTQVLPRDYGFTPYYLMNGGSSWELQASIGQNTVFLRPPSPTQLSPSFYHTQSLR
ncbi:hypothetical protein AXF42_Ash008390 [Apostasia shenzhenica]|uniref:UBZ4-type domain-containing protein n=1 Tax=Apostasia shenzhenica TaxID=1088818 RepID=A0A2I0AXQ7_9ASPA|nr:hypothetical protein AXF42_Ash008390 [Apostasia shenzhenica]